MNFFILCFSIFLLLSSQALGLSNSVAAESNEFDSVVFFSVTQYDPENKEPVSGYCNGNLLSERVLITAAHCLSMAQVLGDRDLDLEVGQYRYVITPNGEKRKVGYMPILKERVRAQLVFTKDIKRRLDSQGVRLRIGPGEDIAVAIFDKPLTINGKIQFNSMATQQELKAILPRVLTYWPTVVTINPFEEISTSDTKRMARLDNISLSAGYVESKSQARVQPGDSGAPLFVRVGPQWKQVGVVKGKAQSIFSDWDVYAIADNKVCDIASQINDIDVQRQLCRD